MVESEAAAWLIRSNTPEPAVKPRAAEAAPSAGGVMFSMMKPAAPHKLALLVLDLVQSTQLVINVGDTYFNTLIGTIYTRFRQHSSASENIFLKCTGGRFPGSFHQCVSGVFGSLKFFTNPASRQCTCARRAELGRR